MYNPAPRPRSLTRNKRSLPETSMIINFGGKALSVIDQSSVELSSEAKIITGDDLKDGYYMYHDVVESMVEEVPLDYNDDFTYNIADSKTDTTKSFLKNLNESIDLGNATSDSVIFIIGSMSVILVVISVIVVTTKKTSKINKKIDSLIF